MSADTDTDADGESPADSGAAGGTDRSGDGGEPDPAALAARVETLEGELERLRAELAAARRTSYRRSAAGMGLLGALALAGAYLFPGVRTVLVALGGTGLFGAVLTYYLTPDRFVGAGVAAGVYDALAGDLEAVAAEFELSETAVYVPGGGDPSIRLYIPEQPPNVAGLPDDDALRNALVVAPDHRGLSLRPTGGALYAELEEAAAPLPEAPPALAATVGEALVEQFELVETADPDLDLDESRATFRVTDSAYGHVDRLDHPVGSLVATALASVLERPVELDVTAADDPAAYLVTCRWDLETDS